MIYLFNKVIECLLFVRYCVECCVKYKDVEEVIENKMKK